MPMSGARREVAWPKVPQARMHPEEVRALRDILRAQGLTFAQWIRQQMSGVPSRGRVDPKVQWLSFKVPEPYARAAHDALIIQANALDSMSQRQRKDDPLEAVANKRLAGQYIDASSFFSAVGIAYADLHRKRAEQASDTSSA